MNTRPVADPRRRARHAESGAVLLLVMMLMISLFGLGVTALWLTGGNLQIGANVNQRMQALYVAEAGIERARAILNGPPVADVNDLMDGSGNAGDDVPVALDAAGNPVGVGAIMLDGTVPLSAVVYPPASFNRSAGTATAPVAATMGTYTVWIRNDTADCRRGKFTVDTNGSVVVRSRGLAPDNLTSVVLEVPMGGVPGSPASAGGATTAPVLCNSGKNACDENSSTAAGVVVN
jgi:hypothetical protein